MGQDGSEITEQVVKFPPKQGNSADEAGQAVIAQIRRAAELANENCDRAMALAHKLAMQLRAAEDQFQDRATRAEGWLQTIHSEIEQKLIAPRVENTPASLASPAPRHSRSDGIRGQGRGLRSRYHLPDDLRS